MQDLWPEYMNCWLDNGINLGHLPYAGNLMDATSRDFTTQFRACFVGNLSHKKERFNPFILPILERLRFLNLSCRIYGDNSWRSAQIPNYGMLYNNKELSNLYSQSMVCFNFHTQVQVDTQAYINERSFAIQLYGGLQITDMPLAQQYFDSNVLTGSSVTKFIGQLEGIIKLPRQRFLAINGAINNAADNHTYFNRLCTIFDALGMRSDLEKCCRVGLKLIKAEFKDVKEEYESSIKKISRGYQTTTS